jgi:DNA-binding LytR/AlgR family response regulator
MDSKVHLVGKNNVLPSNVIFLKAEANYSEVFLINGKKILISKTLKELEGKFAPFGFFRAHKSFLINLEHVISFSSHRDRFITLTDNFKADLSRRKRNDFVQLRGTIKKAPHF